MIRVCDGSVRNFISVLDTIKKNGTDSPLYMSGFSLWSFCANSRSGWACMLSALPTLSILNKKGNTDLALLPFSSGIL